MSSPDPYLKAIIESKSPRIFTDGGSNAQLKFSYLDRVEDKDGEWSLKRGGSKIIRLKSEFQEILSDHNHHCALIYTIQSPRSWAKLDISYELFEELRSTHRIFADIWISMFAFTKRYIENEYNFPLFRSRRSSACLAKNQELTYVIRRVESTKPLHPSYPPWSVRQTGVYHQINYSPRVPRSNVESVFVLVTPSITIEQMTSDLWPQNMDGGEIMIPGFAIHELIVTESLRGWVGYMAWLENELQSKYEPLILVQLGDESSIDYYSANDQQYFKRYEDRITDLVVILQTLVHTISNIKKSCQQHCQMSCSDISACICGDMIERFEQHNAEASVYCERAKVLKGRVRSIQELLANFLSFDESRAMKKLEVATQKENRKIKILAFISLIFVPFALVENFFSTQLVRLNEAGDIQVSHDIWIMILALLLVIGISISLWKFESLRRWLRALCKYLEERICRLRIRFQASLLQKRKERALDVEEGAQPVILPSA